MCQEQELQCSKDCGKPDENADLGPMLRGYSSQV